MANAMLDARQEGDSYRRVEVITGERRRRRWTGEEKARIAEFIQGENFKSPYGKDLQRFLKHGLGLHHAGLLPRYRVLVEKLGGTLAPLARPL